ncbi:MAG: multiheme c-type cytochrome, partial [Planctomycetota bacterium]|jgi:hypothetical protein
MLETAVGPVPLRAYLAPGLGEDVSLLTGDAIVVDPVPASIGEPAAPRRAVVLFHGEEGEARAIFSDREDIALVLCANGRELPSDPERLPGGALLVTLGDKGKYAAVVALVPEHGAAEVPNAPLRAEVRSRVGLNDRVPDEPRVGAIYAKYRKRLFEENLGERMAQKPLESGGSFVGPSDCRGCHAAEYAVFKDMKHAHALDSLKAKNAVRDPECLRCHTTGFGFQTGFVTEERTPHLGMVSCESCHGVGSNHAQTMMPGFGRIPDPAKLCVECHDKENSPNFDFDKYWSKIKHGRRP